jgi:hypothetical protein
MSDLEKVRNWIATFPKHHLIAAFSVDLIDDIPARGSIAPSGLVEVSRSEDILGSVAVVNQYNFGLYYTFRKDPGNDTEATQNAEWLMDFQKWVQEQSLLHLAPTFGDEPRKEQISAQNGSIYDATEDGMAIYVVQLSVQFTKKYEL